jgi:hypothetical protein
MHETPLRGKRVQRYSETNRGVSLMFRESCYVHFGNVIKRNQALANVAIGWFESAARNQTRRP